MITRSTCLAFLGSLLLASAPAGADYTYQYQFGSFGSGDGQFGSPGGVAVDGSGNVFVADSFNQRIVEFTNAGAFIRAFGTAGNGPLASPVGVAVDGSGNVFVSDQGISRIVEFTNAGAFVRTFGSSGSGDGQFSIPFGVAVD